MSNETVIPLGEYADGDFYPGYEPRLESRPFLAEPLAPFTREDESRFWMRDSQHFSEGITPASMGLLEDAQTWGTQYGAEIVGIPPTAGMVNRIAGVHVYLGQCPITSPWQIGARAERFGAFAGPRLADFATYWAGYRAELEAAYAHFDALDVDALVARRAARRPEGRARLPPPRVGRALRGDVPARRQLRRLLPARRRPRARHRADRAVARRRGDVVPAHRR